MFLKLRSFSVFAFLVLFSFLSIAQSTPVKPSKLSSNPTIKIKILGINDFHGQISSGRVQNNKPVGGAAVLAAYLKQAQLGMEDSTIITIMGDQVGASTPASSLLNDEPTILFTNSLGNNQCTPQTRMSPLCNIVATVGNHEFDRGQQAMMDLINGTDKPPTDFWIPLPYYPGANYPYISANIVNAETEKTIFPPYVIKLVHGVPVAFIGAVLKNAADSMFPSNAKGVKFLNEAQSINQYIPEIKANGAEIIIVLIHEGGNQIPYEGDSRLDTHVEGSITQIVNDLDDSIDVVMGGHTHQFLNAYIPNRNGIPILVTQANSYSASFAEVTLEVDSSSHKVDKKSARIITTYADQWPGTAPDEQVKQLVTLAEDKVEHIIKQHVGTVQKDLLRKQNAAGESNLGNLITDAMRTEMQADFGITNPHGLRDDINAGDITWGKIYSVLPFSNHIVSVTLTGNDIYELLEQQWMGPYINMLQVSGLSYIYDPSQPLGQKVIEIKHQDKPLIRDQTYTIATTDFLASGGGVFSVMKRSRLVKEGDNDHDTVIHYIKKLEQPFKVSIEGRIRRIPVGASNRLLITSCDHLISRF